jgi:hypothetical protein
MSYGDIINTLILIVDIAIVWILIVEYYYDKRLYDKKLYKTINKKANTVVVDIEGGVGTIKYKPKNINVVINTKSTNT